VGIAVLGPLSIDGVASVLGRRDRAVLSALAVRPGDVLSADQLAEVLWQHEPPASWAKVIQGCVVRLRKVLGPGSIETLPSGYRLTMAHDQIDSQRFERATERARALLAASDEADRAAFVLGEALALWRGQALGDVEDWGPGRIEAGRLGELHLEAEELYVEASLRTGHSEKVLARAQTLVHEQPLRERRWALLALAQYQAGQQNEALITLRRVRKVFNRDLGVDPGPDLAQLEQAMLRQDPALFEHAPLPEPSAVCPYRGLLPYDTDNADTFFGRAEDVDACLQQLSAAGVLAVVGPSGSGKSSMVRAGVMAALRRDGRDVMVLTPGRHPAEALALLPRRRATTTLVVDQCEEVYSLCADLAERVRFLDALVEHATAGSLVVAIRADHLVDVSAHRGFAGVVERGLHLISGMREAELRAAIVEPARLAGLDVEPALVEILVREVSGNPGALPMLSHALQETWQRREGRTLTVAGYQASGGIREAVARSAEEVYSGVATDQQPMLRALLLRLVAPSPEGDPVRTRMPRRLVVTDPAHEQLVDLLVGSRLVTSDEGVVEIAHEALAREWPRLRDWLEEDVEGQRILHHLASSADSWDALGKPDSELYRGVRLAKALDWRTRTTPTLSALEREFLEAGERLAHAELRSAEERARHQAKVSHRLRGLLAVAAVLLLATSAAGTYALRQSRRAESAADSANRAATAEQARRIGANALLAPDISESLLLAVQGVRLDDSPETRANLLAAMARQPRLVRSVPAAGDYIDFLDVSPDGGRIAFPDDKGGVYLYDAATSRRLGAYQTGAVPAPQRFSYLDFSPGDEFLAVGLGNPAERPVRLLDTHTMKESGPSLAVPGRGLTRVNDIEFSGNGRYLVATVQRSSGDADIAADAPAYVLVWDLTSPAERPEVVRTDAYIQGLAVSRDGRTVYTSTPLSAYDVNTGRQLWTTTLASFFILDISPNGRLLVSSVQDDDSFVRLTDVRTGKTLRILRGHRDGVRDVRFSRDGSRVVSASRDGQLIVWDVSTGDPIAVTDTFEVSWSVDFSPDGHRIYTGGDDAALRTWDLYGDQQFLRRIFALPSAKGFHHVHPSPDGTLLAFVDLHGPGSTIRFLDTVTGKRTFSAIPGTLDKGTHSPGAWHPDGRHYSVYQPAGMVTVLDATTGEQVVRRRVVDDAAPLSMAYVDQGARLMVGDSEGRLIFVDAETLLPSGPRLDLASDCCAVGLPDSGSAVVFDNTPDGAQETWQVIDTRSGDVLRQGHLDLRANAAEVSPDGEQVAVTGNSGEVMVIDVSSGSVARSPASSRGAEGYWVRWSSDGSRIASGADDGTVSLWSAMALDPLGTVVVPEERDSLPVTASFTADDQITVASYDGRVYQWDTDFDRAVAFACQMAGRNLSETEWEAALPDLPYEETCPSS
jgi:WD40 repeat protein/DNA-binding SARP family transcriptional activator